MDNCSAQQVIIANSGERVKSDFQSFHILIYKMFIFKPKVMKHEKKQESMVQSQDEKNHTEIIPEEAQRLKSTVFNTLKELKKPMEKQLKETRRAISQHKENINKEINILNRIQIEILKL